MSRSWHTMKLSTILRRSNDTIEPDADTEYREITVRLWGKGVVERGRISGTLVRGKRQVARAGQFIVSRIDARNGAMGLVPESLEGALVTNDFPLFDVNVQHVEAQFLGWLCRTAGFVELCRRASEGTTNRVRLKEDRFLALEIPLPPLSEQRRIVGRIEEVAAEIHEARRLRQQAAEQTSLFALSVAADLFPNPVGEVVGDHIRFQSGYAFKSEWFSEEGIRLARNANIGHGSLDWTESARIPAERRSEFANFELGEGDLLVSLDRPIISTGVKVAEVANHDLPALLLQRVARAQFQGDRVLPRYFFRWLRSPHFINAIDPGRSNGVPHISHKDIEKIPFAVPALAEQRRIVAQLDALYAEIDSLKRLREETSKELDALLPAILEKAIEGKL